MEEERDGSRGAGKLATPPSEEETVALEAGEEAALEAGKEEAALNKDGEKEVALEAGEAALGKEEEAEKEAALEAGEEEAFILNKDGEEKPPDLNLDVIPSSPHAYRPRRRTGGRSSPSQSTVSSTGPCS